jgi:hypothetical protein
MGTCYTCPQLRMLVPLEVLGRKVEVADRGILVAAECKSVAGHCLRPSSEIGSFHQKWALEDRYMYRLHSAGSHKQYFLMYRIAAMSSTISICSPKFVLKSTSD